MSSLLVHLEITSLVFVVLIPNAIDISKYKYFLHKKKFFGSGGLSNFFKCQSILRPKSLRCAVLEKSNLP